MFPSEVFQYGAWFQASAAYVWALPTPFMQLGQQANIFRLEKRARDYLALINSEPIPDSVPYVEALSNKRMLAELDSTKQALQEKIKKLTGIFAKTSCDLLCLQH